jgi:hypothetical protein
VVEIPESFIKWAYEGRAELIRRQASGEQIPPDKIFLGFTRHNPTVISHGSAGLNGSIKGVGLIPKAQYLQETLDAYQAHIATGWRDGYPNAGLQLLVRYLYGESCRERIDFSCFGSLELARDHSWVNLNENPISTLLFYQPPAISFEVRCRAECIESGPLHTLINAQHDVYHQPHVDRWPNRPAYIFHIEEIYDNSATKDGFGKRIY